MANQALIQAAQRMYSAKAAKAERDISPILQAGLYTTQNIKTAIEQKRENQKEKPQKVCLRLRGKILWFSIFVFSKLFIFVFAGVVCFVII